MLNFLGFLTTSHMILGSCKIKAQKKNRLIRKHYHRVKSKIKLSLVGERGLRNRMWERNQTHQRNQAGRQRKGMSLQWIMWVLFNRGTYTPSLSELCFGLYQPKFKLRDSTSDQSRFRWSLTNVSRSSKEAECSSGREVRSLHHRTLQHIENRHRINLQMSSILHGFLGWHV